MGIAALNILLPLYSTFFGFGMMCGIGGSVLFGFSRGKGNEREARGYFTTGLLMALVFAVLTLTLCNVFFDPLLRLLGVTPAMREHAVAYGRVLVTASPMCVMSSFLQAFVRNDGAPKLAMAGVISGGVTNVILDYVFIFIMKWGMGGAMLATATGTTLTVLILSSHFLSKENHLKPIWNVSLKKVLEILGNGLASFILEVSNGFVTFLFNRQLLAYVGDLGVVVYGIISNTALVVTSISNGMAQAVQPLLSANYGAGKRDRVRQGLGLGIRVALGCGLDLYGVGIFLSHPAGVPVFGAHRGDPFHGGPGHPSVFPGLPGKRVEHHVQHLFPIGGAAQAFPDHDASQGSGLKYSTGDGPSGHFRCQRHLAGGNGL